MLSAQKKLLDAAEQGAQLQSSELTYFTQNFGTMMTMSSVIGGFAFSGILIPTTYNEDGMWKDNINWIVDIYYTFAAMSVGSCMAAAIICMAINVRGPGLALRGPDDGSLKRAVEGMRKWQRRCIWCLLCGVVCFHLEGMTYAWLMLHNNLSQVLTTLVFVGFLGLMGAIAFNVFRSFQIAGGAVESGMLSEDQFQAAYRRLAGEAPAPISTADLNYGTARRHKRPPAAAPRPDSGFTSDEEEENDDSPTPSSVSQFFFGDARGARVKPKAPATLV